MKRGCFKLFYFNILLDRLFMPDNLKYLCYEIQETIRVNTY